MLPAALHKVAGDTREIIYEVLANSDISALGAMCVGIVCASCWQRGIEPDPARLRLASRCTDLAQGTKLAAELVAKAADEQDSPERPRGKAPSLRVLIQKKPDDTAHGIVRVAIGGTPDNGYYCAYHGRKSATMRALDAVFRALLALDGEPEITDDERVQ